MRSHSAVASGSSLITPDAVRDVVARMLKVDPACLDPARSLTSFGLDSLTAMELVADLEDVVGRRLPDWFLSEHPTVASLSEALCGTQTALGHELSLMSADSRLPDDIRPVASMCPVESPRHVLLTGATGFLGASLLSALLEDIDVHVTCLVRPNDCDPLARVRQNLDQYDLCPSSLASRLTVMCGDLSLPALGLGIDRYNDLARSVGAIYHAGADVNWVLAYSALRHTNVLGTTELLRLTCTGRPKQFHFVSSLSVCYASDGPAIVSESTDMLPYVAGLPLGYAQTKCVAETLVRQAAARGLSARIYRPALLAGDARTGRSNLDDLIGALLKGCIQMGAAPDLDWAFDAVPVDCAARAIVRLAQRDAGTLQTVHLRHPRPRRWRECILWANFFGYRIRLEPFDLWRQQLEREAARPGHALHRLRSFFIRRVGGHRTVAELYEEGTRSTVEDDRSLALHRASGIDFPTLDPDLLNRYFQDYIARGFLPEPRPGRGVSMATTNIASQIPPLLRTFYGDERLHVRDTRLVRAGSDRSIIGELMSWRHGRRVGLCHYRLDIESFACPSLLDVIVKAKAIDEDVLEVVETTAEICDAPLARELRRFRDFIGVHGNHLRELAIYEFPDERLRRHMPVCYGTWRRDDEASWGLVLERLDDMVLLDASDDVAGWTEVNIAAAIDGLATLHSVWLGREAELCRQSWIGHVATRESVDRMTPLWQALAHHAAPRFGQWAGPALVATHRRLAETVGGWWPAFEKLPRTLIHNDFNSRNIAIRRTLSGPLLVAYDWELATIGAPQRDLAELLCFVLPSDVGAETMAWWVEHHRTRLEQESGRLVPSDRWRAGFVSALVELLVNRLSFYALIDRITPQPFLARVVRTWRRLHELTANWDADAPEVWQ